MPAQPARSGGRRASGLVLARVASTRSRSPRFETSAHVPRPADDPCRPRVRADVERVSLRVPARLASNVSRCCPAPPIDPAGDVISLRRRSADDASELCGSDVDDDAGSVAAGADRHGDRRAARHAAGRRSDATRRRSSAAMTMPSSRKEVESRTNDEVGLSATFLAFMTVATLIASVGVVTDHPILIVGAMVVGRRFRHPGCHRRRHRAPAPTDGCAMRARRSSSDSRSRSS